MMRETIDAASVREGRNQSRLPVFDDEWKERLRGSLDFLGVNHYTTELVTPGGTLCLFPGWRCDQDLTKHKDPSWEGSASAWLVRIYIFNAEVIFIYDQMTIDLFELQKKVPWGLRKLLNWIKVTYGT